ncbi:unnamed protein product [Arabis nemorensis]|uniref:Uncharacterized protein n=1 Tax=Arabis nemorensis TaxID=586526 RepID=A0A565C3P2_9BRAS|nr:unnamed protein product [Arabis nemorensis]
MATRRPRHLTVFADLAISPTSSTRRHVSRCDLVNSPRWQLAILPFLPTCITLRPRQLAEMAIRCPRRPCQLAKMATQRLCHLADLVNSQSSPTSLTRQPCHLAELVIMPATSSSCRLRV